METRILGTSEEDIERAAEIIRQGGLVAFPTETVYGLGADALNPEAVGKVYAAKGRPSDNPMIVHISSKDDLTRLTFEITEDMKKLADVFWPGPLTMVVPARPVVPKVTTGGLDTVAVRMPSDLTAASLITASGVPIAAPSANLSGKPSPTTARHVIDDLDGRIDAIIEGGDCQVGIESTVVDMTGSVPAVLRPGIITQEQLSSALGKTVELDPVLLTKPEIKRGEGLLETDGDFKPKSPGMKYKHYAPKAEMIIYKGDREKAALAMAEEKLRRVECGQKVEIIIYDDEEPEKAAREFFAKLRACDKAGVDVILAAALKEDGVGFAVMNRMFKSAGYNIVEV
ncbi:MAG: threonylcarbamoyl-AMP synthase [Firmicutes bacterium]|nr:threonylcarbamoyl-AMP synthase [Bacillota bacterium]